MRSSRGQWAVVIVTVVAVVVGVTVAWVGSPAVAADPRAVDADTIQGHGAGPSNGTKAQRAGNVLWALPNGNMSAKALPLAALSNRYVNDDRVETMQAAAAGNVLVVSNAGAGDGLKGVAGSDGDGVVGQAFHASKSGVYGYHDGSGFGVTGRSSSGFGLLAWGGGDASGYDAVGDLVLQGTRGEIFAFGDYLNLFSNWNINLSLDEDNNDSSGAFRIWNGADSAVFRVDEDGNMTATGTKSAVVETESYGPRLMYALESTGVWFEDFGTGSLLDGVAVVQIEPVFAETVNLDTDYQVFLTPLGDCGGLYVAAKTPTSFEVRELGGGNASVSFDYRIVAKRLGYEELRLEEVDLPESTDPAGDDRD